MRHSFVALPEANMGSSESSSRPATSIWPPYAADIKVVHLADALRISS